MFVLSRCRRSCAAVSAALCLLSDVAANAQTLTTTTSAVTSDASPATSAPATPDKVDVKPIAEDEEIAERLRKILEATGWFANIEVRVDEGVVFLRGTAQTQEVKDWAGNLSRRTQDVVAIVNQLEVAKPPIADFSPAVDGLRELWRDTIGSVPFLMFGLMIFAITWFAARLAAKATRRVLLSRVQVTLLREVFARAVGFIVLVLGIYIVLKVAGLTRLALTVIGGTGIIGLVIGIAFRDITENFLASIFLSMQRPFLVGDLIEITGITGYVQRLTVRTTVLMTFNGNQVEIPNATVYKSTIRNYTSNKNRREDFTVGIGYDDPIPAAQEVALKVLREHPAVLKEPEPWALVDSLGASTVVLKIYFWLDGSEHSWIKVKSSVIRLIKRAFQDAGISMPDESREVVFPQGVPMRMLTEGPAKSGDRKPEGVEQSAVPDPERNVSPAEPVATGAEGGLNSEAGEIKSQAERSRQLQGDNLLAHSPSGVDK
jgi:small conductance mechanosensitive channel